MKLHWAFELLRCDVASKDVTAASKPHPHDVTHRSVGKLVSHLRKVGSVIGVERLIAGGESGEEGEIASDPHDGAEETPDAVDTIECCFAADGKDPCVELEHGEVDDLLLVEVLLGAKLEERGDGRDRRAGAVERIPQLIFRGAYRLSNDARRGTLLMTSTSDKGGSNEQRKLTKYDASMSHATRAIDRQRVPNEPRHRKKSESKQSWGTSKSLRCSQHFSTVAGRTYTYDVR